MPNRYRERGKPAKRVKPAKVTPVRRLHLPTSPKMTAPASWLSAGASTANVRAGSGRNLNARPLGCSDILAGISR